MRSTERLLVAGLALLVAAFQLWTLRSTNAPLHFGQEQRDYYNLLLDGWLDGQLHLKVEVPAALRALDNPYDPALRPPGLGLHDASYYQGRYYLYFGVAPVVTLLLPFRLLTGTDLPQPVAVLVFVYGAFLASVALWRAIQRRHFPTASLGVTAATVLVLGLANSGLLLLRRPDMWELPIAGGAFYAVLMLGCVWRSLQPGGRAGAWFAAAGLCLGLAIASRPTYLLASPCLLPPLLAWWRDGRRLPWRQAGCAVLPLAVVGGLMAWHNFARFGDPLQFGQAYQFSLDYESKQPHFGLHYVPFNLRAHFLAAAEWSRYFPFIAMADLGPTPAGYTVHRGDVYGLLANLPLTALALLAPFALWRRPAAERRALGAWLATAGLLCALAAGVMLSFFSALARYQVEFAPTFTLLALVGLLAVERWLATIARPAWRRSGRALWGAAAVMTVLFGILNSLQYDRLLPEQNPRLHRELARTLNRIPAAWERLSGREHGPLEFTLRLPAERRAGDETLLSVGDPPQVDRVFLRVRPDGRCHFGLARPGRPELLGEALTLDAAATHQVRVSIGSLLPPAAHPFFSGWDEAALARAVRQVRIEVNGVPVLSGHDRFLATAAGRVRLGARALGHAAAPRFRGEIGGARRVPLLPAALAGRAPFEGPGDTLRLRVRLPAGHTGEREPLVVTGTAGAGDLLLVEYLDGGRIRFALDHWGSPLRHGPPVAAAAGGEHEIDVSLGSLQSVPDATLAGIRPPERVRVRLDGVVVWEETIQLYPAEAGEIHVGRNPLGGTSAGAAFTGEVLEVTRVARE